jgi:hypothetical protein
MWRLEPAAPTRLQNLFVFDPASEGSKRQTQNTGGQNLTFGSRAGGPDST